ncbi:MAG: hypothetical protein EOP52_03780 [Sphingobacteriales bacterium]|nr:MAG: hypothetical protein EOP52_03780 [Sphingobacteriales bacterium]
MAYRSSLPAYRSPLPGVLLGLALPVLTAALLKLVLLPAESFSHYPQLLMSDPRLASKVLSIAVLPNMLAMMYFNRRKQLHLVRGLMVVNVLWIILFLLQRFVWS